MMQICRNFSAIILINVPLVSYQLPLESTKIMMGMLELKTKFFFIFILMNLIRNFDLQFPVNIPRVIDFFSYVKGFLKITI